ncbi:hypothetical protein KDW_29120 [Dictyobacter vulcani]|uniref:N-acetyltransferase domain-containing protein n=1 Tax=Dictyobacter vulcani TaxID=2607529 RepID=A0A5J4KQN7_9CHLR|nr:GNAT family N-acetyltransferase [Dictyobacter vulcani]GER88750.1 hypothetical protein KDW_29120 [Dictyobacter vulcani]
MPTKSSRELLQLHLEAVWGISLPELTSTHTEITGTGSQPPWQLYIGELETEQLYIWRSDLSMPARSRLLQSLEQKTETPAGYQTRSEVALTRTAPTMMDLQTARSMAHRLNRDDYSLMEDFETGSSDYFLQEQVAPVFGVIEENRLLSVAHSSRRTAHACELGVETHAQARRRGFALAVTLLWANAVEQDGLLPFYSALAENSASLKLAHSAGYRPFVRGTSFTPIQDTLT